MSVGHSAEDMAECVLRWLKNELVEGNTLNTPPLSGTIRVINLWREDEPEFPKAWEEIEREIRKRYKL